MASYENNSFVGDNNIIININADVHNAMFGLRYEYKYF